VYRTKLVHSSQSFRSFCRNTFAAQLRIFFYGIGRRGRFLWIYSTLGCRVSLRLLRLLTIVCSLLKQVWVLNIYWHWVSLQLRHEFPERSPSKPLVFLLKNFRIYLNLLIYSLYVFIQMFNSNCRRKSF
jgi:hypothetical protein